MKNEEKKYYTLKELLPIVNISYRQLSKRLKKVCKKYCDRKDLIFMKSHKWFIHSSLISEFNRIKGPINYKLFITIASKNQFELEYWKFFICRLNKKLKKIDTSTRIKYVVEKTNNNIYHIHFITTFSHLKKLKSIIKKDDLTNNSNDMNTQIKEIYEIKNLHKYFRKQYKPVLLK